MIRLLIAFSPVPLAMAHHSVTGQFEMAKQITLKGTITKVDWINPHTFIYIDVKDAKGVVSTWKWESLPVAMMRKAKITKGMLVGHSVTALGWASRDGTKHSAFLGALTFADGRKIQIADDMYIKEQG